MNRETVHLREKLDFVLRRRHKAAGYWSAPVTIRMSDEAGDLLYRILEIDGGGWVQDDDRFLLKGCKCTMTIANAGGGAIYRRFYLCPAHASALFVLPAQASIPTEKPEVRVRPQKAKPADIHHKGNNTTPPTSQNQCSVGTTEYMWFRQVFPDSGSIDYSSNTSPHPSPRSADSQLGLLHALVTLFTYVTSLPLLLFNPRAPDPVYLLP